MQIELEGLRLAGFIFPPEMLIVRCALVERGADILGVAFRFLACPASCPIFFIIFPILLPQAIKVRRASGLRGVVVVDGQGGCRHVGERNRPDVCLDAVCYRVSPWLGLFIVTEDLVHLRSWSGRSG